jgi:tRNA pseudouridine55 synthase
LSECWDGLLPIDKPAGPTSHDLVARVRASTGARRVGHTGTLDPPATGLLLLMLGRATRLARFIPDAPKTYCGELSLGLTTSTDDLAGAILRRHDGPLPDPAAVIAAAAAGCGRRMQTPPAYSARHVGGTRLYRLARRGVAVEAPASEVTVERFDVTPGETADRFGYEIVVSAGTYVRAAVRDLGALLGCGAAVASLRRVAIGPFDVRGAIVPPTGRNELRDAARRGLIPLDAIPLTLASLLLASPTQVAAFRAGLASIPIGAEPAEAGLVAVRDREEKLLGIGEARGVDLSPRVVLPDR